MKREIPKQLCNPNFRFFLLAKNKKVPPIEKFWNSKNNYMFFENKLLNHLNNGGNIGVVTGINSLIVIDFDDKEYQDLKVRLLPKTFVTKSANKRLQHRYYLLEDKMIKKIGIDYVKCAYCGVKGIFPNVSTKCPICGKKKFSLHKLSKCYRLADIQAGGYGAVCPPSNIKDRCYQIIDDSSIAHIDCKTLNKVFGIKDFKESRKRKFEESKEQPKKIQETIDLFKKLGIKRTNDRHFQCPHHAMHGSGNMWVGNSGEIHCFHCNAHYNSAKDFKAEWEDMNGGIVII